LAQGGATAARYDGDMENARRDRKTMQLCRQVQKALTFALGETGDELLLLAYVEDVEPAPDTTHMLVSVRAEGDPIAVMQALYANTGKLRSAVAQAITRRKAPDLAFKLV
jgi:ribosome-binding factor A